MNKREISAGYVLVPVEPTPEMLDVAVSLNVSLSGDYNWSAYMRDIWSRMIAAAPQPVAQQKVVMPERAIKDGGKFSTELKVTGWNACLDEFERLNGGKP